MKTKLRFLVLLALAISIFTNCITISSASADGDRADWTNKGVQVERWVVEESDDGSRKYVRVREPEVQQPAIFCATPWERPECAGVQLRCDDGNPNTPAEPCITSTGPPEVLEQIAGQIQAQFEHLPISPGRVSAQPEPHTLIRLNTNFYASASTQEFDIVMLEQSVHITAVPVAYTFRYGDGTVLSRAANPGRVLKADAFDVKTETSHAYQETGDFQASVTTHFRGTYSVNGGPALPIPGEGSFTTQPITMSVWRSETRLVADDCVVNPNGWGC